MKNWHATATLGVQVLLLTSASTPLFAQGRSTGMPGRVLDVRKEVRVTSHAPEWLAAPTEGRLRTSEGVAVQPLQNAAVSYENESIGLLVGAFRNAGACAQDVSIRFQYVNAQWQPIGDPIENEARVTVVEPGDLLPYRFRLKRKSDFAQQPAGYVIEIDASRPPDPESTDCPVAPHAFEVRTGRSRSTSRSYEVTGTVRLVVGGPIRPDGVTLTALLLDKDDQVLEVLTGAPNLHGVHLPTGMLEDAQVVPFTLATPVPLARRVTRVEVFAEVLPGAKVAR